MYIVFYRSYGSRSPHFAPRHDSSTDNKFSKKFDVIICMYHDQATIPLKIIDFENGTDEFLDRSVFDPYFENADNELVGRRYYIDHSFNLNKKSDSIKSNSLIIGNTISYEKRFYKFVRRKN